MCPLYTVNMIYLFIYFLRDSVLRYFNKERVFITHQTTTNAWQPGECVTVTAVLRVGPVQPCCKDCVKSELRIMRFLLILMRKETGWRVWACWINTVKIPGKPSSKMIQLKFRAERFLVKWFQTQHHCLFRSLPRSSACWGCARWMYPLQVPLTWVRHDR